MAKIKAGDKFPNYTVDSVYGTDVIKGTTIEKIMNGKPTMFWFQRYMGCPPCRLDVHLLVMNYEKFIEKGVEVVVVMQSKPEIVLDVPYAKYLYYGKAMEGRAPKRVTDRDLVYTKTKNPQAGPFWDRSLAAAEGDAMAEDVQRYLKWRRK